MTRHSIAALGILLAATLAPAADRLRVVATTPDLASLARAVGGDAVEVTALAREGEDPHFVDPKPSFIRTLNQADVLVEGGASLEAGWLPPLLEGARNPRIATGAPGRIVASDGITLLDTPARLDRSLGDVHPTGNPHFLLDPVRAEAVARAIARALCTIDAARCAGYEVGAARLAASIDAKVPAWRSALAPLAGTKVVTYHKNYDYLAERFGFEVMGTLEPKPGLPPSPSHLAELVPRMQAAGVRLVLVEPYRSRQTADFVAEKTGARVVVLPIMPGSEDGGDYVAFIDHDVRELAAKLTR
jgi:ABC-type Zn uptake system ZnuABC Zn-binding protein ZnuA